MDPGDPAKAGRFDSFKTSFSVATSCLLTACPREEFNKFFPSFTDAERERLYRMFTTVMRSLRGSIQKEFDDICQEQKVAAAFDKLDEFVERKNLDVLSSDKTSIEEVKDKLSRAKKDEIEYLTGLLRKVEENNNTLKAEIEPLKKNDDSAASTDGLNKMKQLYLHD
ncbi:hypothetical protein ACP4OV_029305 [Aristida adscensionis]